MRLASVGMDRVIVEAGTVFAILLRGIDLGISQPTTKPPIIYRPATLADVPQLIELEKSAWGEQAASEPSVVSRIRVFPPGQLLAVMNDAVVGYASLEFVDDVSQGPPFTWADVTDSGSIARSHKPDGGFMYGVNLAVHHSVAKQKVGDGLILQAWHLMVSHNRTGTFIGSRIPGFRKFRERHPDISVEEYIRARRIGGRLRDYELDLYERGGGRVVKSLPNYFPDPESLDYGVLVAWKNPFYNWPLRRFWAWAVVQLGPLFF